jgi:hypothetical protein
MANIRNIEQDKKKFEFSSFPQLIYSFPQKFGKNANIYENELNKLTVCLIF